MNHYYCSNGERVTDSQIKSRLRKAYIEDGMYNYGIPCEGCGKPSCCHAHIVPKARCKVLRKTELIWDHHNWFYSCIGCNLIAENVSSKAITKLRNFEYIKEYLQVHDPERFNKLPI